MSCHPRMADGSASGSSAMRSHCRAWSRRVVMVALSAAAGQPASLAMLNIRWAYPSTASLSADEMVPMEGMGESRRGASSCSGWDVLS